MRSAMLPMLLLAGCNGGGAPSKPAEPDSPSAFQARVAALPDNERNAVFIRAIRDAGLDCQGVTESSRQGSGERGEPLYLARCIGGATYGVLIGREGTAQVVAAPQP